MARSPMAAAAPMAVHTIWGGVTPGVYRGRFALGGEDLLDEPVVLELEVEPDDVVDGERRPLGAPLEGGDLVVEELGLLGGLRLAGPGGVHVHTGRDEQGHDLAVGPLLHGVGALGALEPIGPLHPALYDREQDGLWAHVHLAAAGTGRPDGGHLASCIGPGARRLEPLVGAQFGYRASVCRAVCRTCSTSSGGWSTAASPPRRRTSLATQASCFVGRVTSRPPSRSTASVTS